MSWFKMHHGMLLEAKLAVIARRAGLKRGEALALWVTLLDHASRATPRGFVRDLDPEELSATLEFDPACLDAALEAFRDKNIMTTDGAIYGWDKYQLSSTRRTRKLREHRRDDEARRRRLHQALQTRQPLRQHAETLPQENCHGLD